MVVVIINIARPQARDHQLRIMITILAGLVIVNAMTLSSHTIVAESTSDQEGFGECRKLFSCATEIIHLKFGACHMYIHYALLHVCRSPARGESSESLCWPPNVNRY